MPHDLEIKEGRASMLYLEEPPWQALGARVESAATVQEALRAAGDDWDVAKEPLFIANAGKDGFVQTGRFAVIRTDTRAVLGHVSGQYRPSANREVFRFLDELVGGGKAVFHTVGVLWGGERVWVLVQLSDGWEVTTGDWVSGFLLVTTSHDATEAPRIRFTPVREACMNTLVPADAQAGFNARELHSGNVSWGFKNAAELLGMACKVFGKTREAYQVLASRQVSREEMGAYFLDVIPDGECKHRNTRTQNTRANLEHLYHWGHGSEFARGTAWGIYNSVTEYLEHCRLARSSAGRRLWSNWFSSGEDINQRALSKALELAKV